MPNTYSADWQVEFVGEGQPSHEPLSGDWTATCPHSSENGCMPESDEELEGALNCCRELDWCVAVHKPGERPDICTLCNRDNGQVEAI